MYKLFKSTIHKNVNKAGDNSDKTDSKLTCIPPQLAGRLQLSPPLPCWCSSHCKILQLTLHGRFQKAKLFLHALARGWLCDLAAESPLWWKTEEDVDSLTVLETWETLNKYFKIYNYVTHSRMYCIFTFFYLYKQVITALLFYIIMCTTVVYIIVIIIYFVVYIFSHILGPILLWSQALVESERRNGFNLFNMCPNPPVRGILPYPTPCASVGLTCCFKQCVKLRTGYPPSIRL